MKDFIPPVLSSIAVGAVWGYFADIQNGDFASFAFRIVFLVFITVLIIVFNKKKV